MISAIDLTEEFALDVLLFAELLLCFHCLELGVGVLHLLFH